MKYKYTLEESIDGINLYCRADLPNTADNLPADMIHTPHLDEVFAWIKEMEK
jgi:hypothetical protein